MKTDQVAIKAAIFEMGLLFNQQPSDEKITAYAKALQNYSPAQIRHAFNQVILSGSAFFPSLAEILAHLRPKEPSADDVGNILANEIIARVQEYGIYRIREAMEALSDQAKQVVAQNTSLLMDIANSEREQLPTIRAQLRGLAKASHESRRAGKVNEKLQRLGIDTSKVLTFGNTSAKQLDYSGFTPDEGA